MLHRNFEIKKASLVHAQELRTLAIDTFLESHGHSAAPEDINQYLDSKFTLENLQKDLSDQKNLYYLVFSNDELVGYSKIILNTSYNKITTNRSCKLERLYVLQKFHGTQIGPLLMDFNVQLAKENKQIGMWLYVWTENNRAIRFYDKYGFKKIADTEFQISRNHSNPNFILYRSFENE